MKPSQLLALIGRLALGGLLVFAAVGKLQDLRGFYLAQLALFPRWAHLVSVIVYGVPATELVLGLFLIGGLRVKPCLHLCTLLFTLFATYHVYAIALGREHACHCLGTAAYFLKTNAVLALCLVGAILSCILSFAAAPDGRWKELPGRLSLKEQS